MMPATSWATLVCVVLATMHVHGSGSGGVMAAERSRDMWSLNVWPIPSTYECVPPGRAGPATLAPGWQFSVADNAKSNAIVQAAVSRYQPVFAPLVHSGLYSNIKTLAIVVSDPSPDNTLGPHTNYNYSVSLSESAVTMTAQTQWGVAYALETVAQLLDAPTCGSFSVTDGPRFIHRGIMIDTGRRFYPVSLVKNILDGMAVVKMNVLHFHLSEECFRVQSTTFPNLTASCENSHGMTNTEVYSHDDIQTLVAYAHDRGIRIVPEFDMPGHSGGFCNNLKDVGLQCCGGQIYDDPAGKSAGIIEQILTEMASLFPDPVLNIGCDETGSSAPCTTNNTMSFEVKMIEHILKLGKTPMGWEEILFKTGAAQDYPSVIVDSWARTSWSQAAAAGHPVVDSRVDPFYLDYPGHTAASMWLDLTDNNTNATELALLLGGEVSMWSDQYVESCLFESPAEDANFSTSTSGCIWPRSVIAAGSFWGYHADVSASDPEFNASFTLMQQRLKARNVSACPCTTLFATSCSQMGRCGEGYCGTVPTPPPPPAPPANDVLRCADYNLDGDVECHTAWDGDASLKLTGGPASVKCDPTQPMYCAVEAANACTALNGCKMFSLDATKGDANPTVSFFKAPPVPPPTQETALLWGVACDQTDPAQNFSVDAAASVVRHGRDQCVDASGASSTQLAVKTCDGSAGQKFTYDPATHTLMHGTQCVDMYYGGKGPNVGLYNCDRDWNQVWQATNPIIAQWFIEEEADGRCMSTKATGKPGLVWTGSKGAGRTVVWTKY
eukprot:m.26939 g.26939  ORF g.26939 m.26939 type:complete len:781 (-) comp4361_c0_seq1:2909-5251(-)